jgi:hypothetical protein
MEKYFPNIAQSKVLATEPCVEHTSKRKVLGDLFPAGMLTIVSEEKATKKEY